MENDAKRVASTAVYTADAVPHSSLVGAARTSDDAPVDRKKHGFPLLEPYHLGA